MLPPPASTFSLTTYLPVTSISKLCARYNTIHRRAGAIRPIVQTAGNRHQPAGFDLASYDDRIAHPTGGHSSSLLQQIEHFQRTRISVCEFQRQKFFSAREWRSTLAAMRATVDDFPPRRSPAGRQSFVGDGRHPPPAAAWTHANAPAAIQQKNTPPAPPKW